MNAGRTDLDILEKGLSDGTRGRTDWVTHFIQSKGEELIGVGSPPVANSPRPKVRLRKVLSFIRRNCQRSRNSEKTETQSGDDDD